MSLGLVLILGAAAPAGAAARHKRHHAHHTVKVKPPCKNVLHTLGRHPQSRLLRDVPLSTGAKLKKAFNDSKTIVQRVFEEARLGKPVADELIAAVAALPDDARPRDVPVGTKFDWMGYRKHGKARVMFDACWLGKGPFQAWTFSVPGGPNGDVDVIVPVPCGNISRVQPPTCVLNKIDQGDGTVILDLTGSKAGSAPIASYGSNPELPQSPPGRFPVTTPKCEPGANCTSVKEELWVEDVLGFRSAPGQCPYEITGGTPVPPLCQLKVTYDNGVFHVDATGTGVAVQSITVTGNGPDGATAQGTMTGGQRTTDISFTPTKSGDWTFTSDVLGENGLHANCTATVRVCVPPVAKLAPLAYNCETRQLGIDVSGSSDHRVVTVMGETLSGNGPTWTYDVKHSGTYTVELTADDGICPDKATATATVDVKPFGDTARWTFRAFGAYVRASADDDAVTPASGVDLRRKINLGAHHGGFGAGFEYRPLHVCDLSRWGIAVDAISSELDSHFLVDRPAAWGRVQDKVSFTPVLLSLNYHLTPGKPVDLFIGPSIGYAFLDSVTYNTLGSSYSEKFKDDFTYGLNLGIDVPFGTEHNYAFTAGLRQLFFKAKGSGTLSHSFDLNPTIATAGIAFRFR
ncbi:MAG: hypothetical protein ACJ76Y_12740 [Thermoanaerobaculia bacterium]